MKPTIVIAGAGGIGKAAALLLANSHVFESKICIGDLYFNVAQRAAEWVREGCTRPCDVVAFAMPESGSNDEMDSIMEEAKVLLDCLPGSQAPRMAGLAKKFNSHYANLTEYVDETNQIIEIAKDADTGFVLQTGLAPGFINVLANRLYQDFQNKFESDVLENMSMKVGALSQNAKAPYFYAFTWSPIGVATEYVKEAVVVKDFEKQLVPSLSEQNTILIEGIEYEDNFTSGGAANLPEAFSGKIKNIDYKTLRYPGHYNWVKEVINALPQTEDLPQQLEKRMLEQIPSLEDDVVIVYASVTGRDQQGMLRSIEKSYRIEPAMFGNNKLRAIQSTTAAPLCEVAHMLLMGNWQGVILQSDIDTEAFLNGPFVSEVYGEYS